MVLGRVQARYICEIVSSTDISQVVAFSVIWINICGQIPSVLSANVMKAAGMMIPVNGSANRFVSRKYNGNVPKYRYVRGAVVT